MLIDQQAKQRVESKLEDYKREDDSLIAEVKKKLKK